MTVKKFTTGLDGVLDGLRVVGFNGRLGSNQTPARSGPVLADARGHLAFVREASPHDDGFTVTVEITERPIPARVWEDTGTRIDPPWEARLGHMVVIVGDRELECAFALANEPNARVDGVRDFLRWLPKTDVARSDELRCVRVDGLVAWYCDRPQADALWQCIAAQARREVERHASSGRIEGLTGVSFWLQRAARGDDDIALASAGLRRANDPRAALLCDLYEGPKAKLDDAVEAWLRKWTSSKPWATQAVRLLGASVPSLHLAMQEARS